MDAGANEHLSDAELLGTARSDPEAFACFYDRYETSVVGRRLLPSTHGRCRACGGLDRRGVRRGARCCSSLPSASTAAAPWLFTIASNALKTSLRRGRVEDQARRRLGIQRAAELKRTACNESRRWHPAISGRRSCLPGSHQTNSRPCARGFWMTAPITTSRGSLRPGRPPVCVTPGLLVDVDCCCSSD